ncbi:hypothetical protein HDK77DRAFT_143656 [Phyllosticta capitalensis]
MLSLFARSTLELPLSVKRAQRADFSNALLWWCAIRHASTLSSSNRPVSFASPLHDGPAGNNNDSDKLEQLFLAGSLPMRVLLPLSTKRRRSIPQNHGEEVAIAGRSNRAEEAGRCAWLLPSKLIDKSKIGIAGSASALCGKEAGVNCPLMSSLDLLVFQHFILHIGHRSTSSPWQLR